MVAYMDVDLATGLDALLPLVAPLLSGHSDVAIGTRLGPGAHVVRGARREFISRGYNLLLRAALRSPCTDAQCGFKAMRREAAAELLPLVEDDEWFFDTEVLVTAQRLGLRIHEVPVDWVDDTDSRVEVLHTALEDLRGRVADARPGDRVRRRRPAPGRSMSRPRTRRRDRRPPAGVDRRRIGRRRSTLTAGRRRPDRRRPAPGPTPRSSPTSCSASPGSGAVSTVAYVATVRRPRAQPGQLPGQRGGHRACAAWATPPPTGAWPGPPGTGSTVGHRMATAAALIGVSLAFTTGALAATRAVGLTVAGPRAVRGDRRQRRAAVIRFAILRTWVFRPAVRDPAGHRLRRLGAGATGPTSPHRTRGRHDRHPTRQRRHRRRAGGVTTGPTTRAIPVPPIRPAHPAPYGWAPDGTGRRPPGGGPTAVRRPPIRRRRLPPPGRLARLVRGRPQDPAWVRPALVVLLVGTGFLYIWGLGQSGWANSFYSAAVQAGTKSWKAFFFGSSDASNFITVDKPPASLWVMEISARLFGVNAWSILVPQALEGVATVGLLFVTVRRWFSPGAALLAGAVLALTPVATLMFRFNNPDALLTLVLTAAAYATVRAIESGRSRWMVLAGALIGFGFITKMLQALILLPVLALVYLLAGPPEARAPDRAAGLHRAWRWWCPAAGGWRPCN